MIQVKILIVSHFARYCLQLREDKQHLPRPSYASAQLTLVACGLSRDELRKNF